MTQYSLPWGGTSTGDAGPYGADDWAEAWRYLFTNDPTTQGIIEWVAGKLNVTGSNANATVATGAAVVHGTLYVNTANVTVNIPASISSDRTDYIVLRKDHVNQTVRITRLAGTEGGAEPTLTQNTSTYWDIKIASVTTDPANDLTIVKENVYVHLGVPVNGIIYTTDTSAPVGFSEYTSARGRFIVALPSGGTPEGTLGDALTNLESLGHTHDYNQVVKHKHGTRHASVAGSGPDSLVGHILTGQAG